MKFLNCNHCVEEGSRGAYDIAVSPTGDLVLICREHELALAGPFLEIPNNEVAERLREYGKTECERCGECEKEHIH